MVEQEWTDDSLCPWFRCVVCGCTRCDDGRDESKTKMHQGDHERAEGCQTSKMVDTLSLGQRLRAHTRSWKSRFSNSLHCDLVMWSNHRDRVVCRGGGVHQCHHRFVSSRYCGAWGTWSHQSGSRVYHSLHGVTSH